MEEFLIKQLVISMPLAGVLFYFIGKLWNTYLSEKKTYDNNVKAITDKYEKKCKEKEEKVDTLIESVLKITTIYEAKLEDVDVQNDVNAKEHMDILVAIKEIKELLENQLINEKRS